jgi:hypothetical protein
MKTDAVKVLESRGYQRADLAEIVREIQAMERSRLEHVGKHPLPLLSRPVMFRMLADLRRELQAVRKARVSLERLARSRDRGQRRSPVPPTHQRSPKAARRPALFVVQRSEVR